MDMTNMRLCHSQDIVMQTVFGSSAFGHFCMTENTEMTRMEVKIAGLTPILFHLMEWKSYSIDFYFHRNYHWVDERVYIAAVVENQNILIEWNIVSNTVHCSCLLYHIKRNSYAAHE